MSITVTGRAGYAGVGLNLQDAGLQHCCKEADFGMAIGFSRLGPFLLALLIIVSL